MEPKGKFSVIATRAGRLMVVYNEDLILTRGEVVIATGFQIRLYANDWKADMQAKIEECGPEVLRSNTCEHCGE